MIPKFRFGTGILGISMPRGSQHDGSEPLSNYRNLKVVGHKYENLKNQK